MISPNEFWLGLYSLAKAHDNEGLSPADRIANILSQLRKMKPTAQREYVFSLERVLDDLRTLRPFAVAIAKGEEDRLSSLRIAAHQDTA